MSVIYSTLTSLINKVSDEFRKSFLFTIIFTILGFIEGEGYVDVVLDKT